MEKKKRTASQLIGVILLIVAVLIIAFAVHLFITDTDNDSDTTALQTEQETIEEQLPQYESEDLLNYEFEILELPEAAYSILGITQERLSEDIKTWTYENGFSLAHSATFYSNMTVDFNQNAYTMQCVLDDPEQTTITVTYLKARDLLTFHL